MSSWNDFFRGRSPFSSYAAPPPVTEADYQYIEPGELDDYPEPPRPSQHPASSSAYNPEDPRAPDILTLKYRNTIYPLHFPPYSIGEGLLYVGEVKRYAAQKTGVDDPRRLRLIYKGKVLRDDAARCRDEGLKQHSEVTCVIKGTSSRSPSTESSAGYSEGERRRRQKGKGKKRRESERPAERHFEEDTHRLKPTTSVHRNKSSSPAPQPTKVPSRQPTPSNVPTTPMGQLEQVADKFHYELVPLCEKFLNNPPNDAKARQQEYKKLSETILTQIIFKLDSVEGGDAHVKATRKKFVVETQEMLAKLDSVGKP